MQQPRSGSVPGSGNPPAVAHRPGKKPPAPWTTAPLALAFVGPRSLGDFVCAGRCSGMPSATKGVPPLDPQTRAKQPIRVHQVAHHHRSVADAPNGLSAAVPCLQRAFAAYPRSQTPSGIPRPIARGPALDSPGLPRPTDADEQTTTGSALQGEGSCGVRCANAFKSVCLPLATLSLGAARESGGVKSKGRFSEGSESSPFTAHFVDCLLNGLLHRIKKKSKENAAGNHISERST